MRGRSVVTGKERGIVSSMSYEAKACGVTRGNFHFNTLYRKPRLEPLRLVELFGGDGLLERALQRLAVIK